MQLSPIRVDFGSTAPSSTSLISETDHQKHVLQQYSLNRQRTSDTETKECKVHGNLDQLSPRSQALQDLRRSTSDAKGTQSEMKQTPENDDFTVPTPRLQLAEMWESKKSVLQTSLSQHIKPHSCSMMEQERQNLKIEPHMSPIPVISTPSRTRSPLSIVSDVMLEDSASTYYTNDRPVLYNAWTVARPTSSTRHSLLSSSRLMQK